MGAPSPSNIRPMLHLDHSSASCIPLSRTRSTPKGISAQGGRCAACAIDVPCGLEQHEAHLLCPFCHLTQHLYEAARLRVGKIVWLPKISQADLNRFVATMFILMRAPASHEHAVQATLNKMKSIYKEGFELDGALPYEQFLRPEDRDTGNAAARKRTLNFPFSLSDPLLLANALDAAKSTGKLTPAKKAPTKEGACVWGEPRTEGLRLLFAPKPMIAVADAWKADFFARHPPEHWIIEPSQGPDAAQ